MARTAFFGGRADKKAESEATTGSVATTEETATTEELASTRDRTLEERISEDRTVPQRVVVDEPDRTFARRIPVSEPIQGVAKVPVVETPAPQRLVAPKPARVSLLATVGLLLGITAAAATFTGRLAWVGVAAGAVAIVLSLAGVVAGARPHVAGRGLGTLGVLFGVVAIAFGVLAMTHTVSWLDSNVDTVGHIRHWFDTRLPFTKSW